MNETTCSHCGCVLEDGEVLIFQEDVYCADCLRELTTLCQHCGKRIYRQDNEGNADTPLCRQCYSRYYVTCERCGTLIQEEDAYYESDDDDTPYCCHCYQENKTIHNYYYKPEPIFYGSGSRYFGVELEVDGAGESCRNAGKVLEAANGEEEHIYCKHDGSLDSGFEIVTHPMSLNYHCRKLLWDDILNAAKGMGYPSHQANTCGLHCHINWDSLVETPEEQEDTISRILYFIKNTGRNWCST